MSDDEFDEYEYEGEYEYENESDEEHLREDKRIRELENDEELYKMLVDKFNEAKIKTCIDFNDPDYIEKMEKFFENDKVNNEIDNSDGYKILLKGMPNLKTYGEVVALYIPKHIDFIYVNGKYKIYIDKKEEEKLSSLIESQKSDLKDLLDESKGNIKKSFKDKYKKIVLVEPYMPIFGFNISFGEKDQIFYYETIIRNVTVYNTKFEKDIYFARHDESYQKECIYHVAKYGHPTFWINYANEYVKHINYDLSARLFDPDVVPRGDKEYKFNPSNYFKNEDQNYNSENEDVFHELEELYEDLMDNIHIHNIMIITMFAKENTNFFEQPEYTLEEFIQVAKTDALYNNYQSSVKSLNS